MKGERQKDTGSTGISRALYRISLILGQESGRDRHAPWILSHLMVMLLGASLVSAQVGPPGGNSDPQAETSVTAGMAELHVGKALEAMKNNRYQEAVREFRAALALDPNLVVQARFPLAVALFGLKDVDQCRKELDVVRSKTGDSPQVAYYLGRLDLMEGHLDPAIRNFTLAASNPPFPDTAYYLGYAYLKKGDKAKAEEWLHKAAELAPRDFRVEERLALLYQSMGRKEEAEKAFARSDDLHKQDIEATGVALECGRTLDTRPLEEARAVCQKLFDTEDTSKLVTLGTLYGGHRDYADALEPFRRAAELEPDSYEMQYNLGLTYFRLKRYAEARTPLEKAAQLRPDMFETTAPLGAVLYALGDDPAAYQALGRAHELRPENAEISGLLFNVALDLAQQSASRKDYSAALPYLLQAAEIHPGDSQVHRHLADVYNLLGDGTRAAGERHLADRLGQAGH